MVFILVPDARYEGPPTIEQEIFGDQAEVSAFKATQYIPDELWERADALMIWGELRCDREMMDKAPNCRIIVRCGVGYDVVDIKEAGRRRIPACNVPDYGTTDVADHAIGLMLSITRGIVRHHMNLCDDPVENWRAVYTPHVRRLRGSMFGIVGRGRIGVATGLRAKALGMTILFYDPYIPDGGDQSVGFERRESLVELLRDSDIVSLHTPLTDETRNMMNESTIAYMKKDAILINTSRGEIVDLDALTQALKSRVISAAALDVQPQEPPDPNHPLIKALKQKEPWTIGRVVITPHAAWYTPDGLTDIRGKSARAIRDYLIENKFPRNCVNKEYILK